MSITKYKGYELSSFQTEAIDGILNGQNVILSTHTGNGKTLVADYAVNKCFRDGMRVIYTAPIKALSNQKYNQFVKEYGEESVGLLTGDRVINNDAKILVATTEVLRNMIHESQDRVADIRFIILDEIHYISNEERGTVWEEILIFKNKEARIIGLSATIPNIEELCAWISDIHEEDVKQVFFPERIVKQKLFYFDKELGAVGYDDVLKNYHNWVCDEGRVPYRNDHTDFVKYAVKKRLLPALYFAFSRRQCEEKAVEMAQIKDLLGDDEKTDLYEEIDAHEARYPEILKSKSWAKIKGIVVKGIGYHHAGLLPVIKEFMERVFERKLCKVLYATETFAVGINYPVKTACFDSLRKYDGKGFRNLMGSEFLQMSGRAGRRGLDEFGMVFVLADYRSVANGDFPDIHSLVVEPVKSRFSLSYNTTLNLVSRFSDSDVVTFFGKSLSNFQYLRGLVKSKEAVEQMKAKIISNKNIPFDKTCSAKTMATCPVIQQRTREQLVSYQSLMENASTTESEKVRAAQIIADLKQALSKKKSKCSREQIRKCTQESKKGKALDKELASKERQILLEIASRPEVRFKQDYDKRRTALSALGYIDASRSLLPRGEVCSKLHIQEVLVTELLFEGFFHETDEDIINAVAAGLVFEGKPFSEDAVLLPFLHDLKRVFSVMERVAKAELEARMTPTNTFKKEICGVMQAWSMGGDMFDIIEQTKIPEGDFVALCRRTTDLLRQVKNTMPDDLRLKRKLERCLSKIDTGMVSLGL